MVVKQMMLLVWNAYCALRERRHVYLFGSVFPKFFHEGTPKRIFHLPRKSCLWIRWKLPQSHYSFTSLSSLPLIQILFLMIWNQISRICLERLRKRCEIRSVQPRSRPSINLHNASWQCNFHSIVFGSTLCYFRLLSKTTVRHNNIYCIKTFS